MVSTKQRRQRIPGHRTKTTSKQPSKQIIEAPSWTMKRPRLKPQVLSSNTWTQLQLLFLVGYFLLLSTTSAWTITPPVSTSARNFHPSKHQQNLWMSSKSSLSPPREQQPLATTPASLKDTPISPCIIRVLGVGGGGCNAVRNSLVV